MDNKKSLWKYISTPTNIINITFHKLFLIKSLPSKT